MNTMECYQYKLARMISRVILLSPCTLSPCLFNFYAEYIMWNAGLNESQAGIKIAGRNINNLRYADDNSKGRNLLMKVREESEKAGLKFNIQKIKIMAPSPITSWQIEGGKVEAVTFYFLGHQNHCRWIKRCLFLGRKPSQI